MSSKFTLSVDVQLYEVDDKGYRTNSNGLRVSDSHNLGEVGLSEVGAIVSRFHDVAKSLMPGGDEEKSDAPEASTVEEAPPPAYMAVPLRAPGMAPYPYPFHQPTDEERLRLIKARRKYAAALAAYCGCGDVTAHMEGLK